MTSVEAAESAATDAAESPAETERLQHQLDRLDVELLEMVRRRTALARRLGDVRIRAGEPRMVHRDELLMLRRYLALGPGGSDLATLLLRLTRSR